MYVRPARRFRRIKYSNVEISRFSQRRVQSSFMQRSAGVAPRNSVRLGVGSWRRAAWKWSRTPELRKEKKADVEIETVPGVTAASAAASVLGAPLMHDFAVISLSDLMTPLDLIMKRVDCAGQGDMIVCLYNPKSKKRTGYVEQAADILMKYRDKETPVGIVRHAGRKGESSCITTLGHLKDAEIDMFSVVIIGNSQTYVKDGRMITPRGYRL